MSDFGPIEDLVRGLLQNVAPPTRAKLLHTVARDVQMSQRDRIAQQRQPDGSAFEPRRAKPRKSPKGRLRARMMFRKLRLGKHLKAGATANEAWVGFQGRAAAIAAVHQEGLADAPAPGMKRVRYTRRVLLGLTETEQQRIVDLVLEHVAERFAVR